jgi:hypothetical protein
MRYRNGLEESEIHNDNRQSTKFLALPSDELLVEQLWSNYAFELPSAWVGVGVTIEPESQHPVFTKQLFHH